jgi:uncharacterized protein (TIGR03083 family)
MERSELHRQIGLDGAAIAAALAEAPGDPVPSCPGWDVAKLALHVGLAHVWAGEQVRRGTSDPLAWSDLPRAPAGRDRLVWLEEATGRLCDALAASDPDAPAGAWLGVEVHAGFWSRRMAHETAVHRVDAEGALGREPALPQDLAADGVDELASVILPRLLAAPRERGSLPSGSLCLFATDAGAAWRMEVGEGASLRLERAGSDGELESADATLRGTASTLDLWAWGRVGTGSLSLEGDAEVVQAWRTLLRV